MKRGYLKVLIFTLIFFIHCFPIYISASLNLDINNTLKNNSLETFSVTKIFIYSPENISYSFGFNEDSKIVLNVSSTGFAPDIWKYNLRNKANLMISSAIFNPSSYLNITAVEGYNKLEVYANDSSGNNYSEEIIFNVITSYAPIIQEVNSSIYVCENKSLNYAFSVLNNDSGFLEFSIQPINPFYVYPMNYTKGETFVNANIVSGVLNKSGVKTFENFYLETILVNDGIYSDSTEINIYVIEINNPPDLEIIGVKTLWLKGENLTFDKIVSVNDIENGNESSGNFIFNLTWLSGENLFDISNYGVINFTFNSSHLGIYNLSLCVSDLGIDYIHPNISLCSQDGSSIERCQNFSITVTDQNRNPNITGRYPENLSFKAQEGLATYLNITTYDSDYTIPDVYWYVDNNLVEYDSGDSIEEFSYTFDYDSVGEHIINVTITDGDLNDAFSWNVTVLDRVPSFFPRKRDGSGKTFECTPLWVCGFWSTCNQVDVGVYKKEISKKEAEVVKELCVINFFEQDKCGSQFRSCVDLNKCDIITNKSYETKMCKYAENPNCNDEIKNCHHGSCEILTDCGGPCAVCPTCSDGIKNQGEEGIDCGGPCLARCISKNPFFKEVNILYFIFIILIVLMVIIIVKITSILRYSKKFKNYQNES